MRVYRDFRGLWMNLRRREVDSGMFSGGLYGLRWFTWGPMGITYIFQDV